MNINKLPKSFITMLLANTIPVAGIIWGEWRIFDIPFGQFRFEGTESVIIEFFNLVTIITAKNDGELLIIIFYKVFYCIFLTVHFGIIIAVFAYVFIFYWCQDNCRPCVASYRAQEI